MIDKTTIVEVLNELNCKYNNTSGGSRAPLYYSKLALMELCGWIEVSMDEVVTGCVQVHLNRQSDVSYMDEVIRRNHGFTYNNHFREMLMKVLGLVNLERLEKQLDPVKFELFKSSLGTLKVQRDRMAHTHLAKVTVTLAAPSTMVSHLRHVYDGLKDIEACVFGLKV